jgi:hypothetical protein
MSAAQEERRQVQKQKCNERFQTGKVTDTYDVFMHLPYVFVPRHKVEAALRKAREKAEAGERRRLNNKVDQWRR